MKIILVANYLPETNYTRDLSQGFIKILNKSDKLFLCGRKNELVLDGKIPKVDEVWSKGVLFFLPIIFYILKKRPGVVHFQQEFKTYGGIISALIFPWLLLFTKIIGVKIIVTPHGVVSKTQLNKNFLESFGLKDNIINKLLITIFLNYSYRLITAFSNFVTVHAPSLRDILVNEYSANSKKVVVIEHGIREIKDLKTNKGNVDQIYKKYKLLKNKEIILVFGYFSPRKGFEHLINSYSKIIKNKEMVKTIMVLAGDVAKEFVPYKNKIEKLIKKKKIDKYVLITGFIDGVEVDALYRMAKVSVISAIFSFNTSGALAMTLAYKKPLLVADVKPLSEEIRLNSIGMFYNNLDPDSFGKALIEIFSDKTKYNKLIRSVEKTANRRYWKNIAREHYNLYKKN